MTKKGFTLIELLIVIAIIGVLAALLLPNLMKGAKRAKETETKTTIDNIGSALQEYSMHKDPRGLYPPATASQDGNGTEDLVRILNDKGLFQFSDKQLSQDDPPQLLDGWGTPMRYHPWKGQSDKTGAHNKRTFDLWSAGPDGDFTTEEDNLTNWSKTLNK